MVGLLAGCWDQRYPRLIVHGVDRECGRRSIATRGLGTDNVTLVRVSHAHEGGEAGADEFHRAALTSLLSPTSPAASRGALVRYEGTREWVPPRHRLALPQVALQRSTRLTSRSSRRRVLAYRAEGPGAPPLGIKLSLGCATIPPESLRFPDAALVKTEHSWRLARRESFHNVRRRNTIRLGCLRTGADPHDQAQVRAFADTVLKARTKYGFLTYGALAVFAWPALVVCIEGGNGDPLRLCL